MKYYTYRAMMELFKKGKTKEEVAEILDLGMWEIEHALTHGATLHRPRRQSLEVGMAYKHGDEYVVLYPNNKYIGSRNGRLVILSQHDVDEMKLEPVEEMTTEKLLKIWGVRHDELMRVERKLIDDAKKALPPKELDDSIDEIVDLLVDDELNLEDALEELLERRRGRRKRRNRGRRRSRKGRKIKHIGARRRKRIGRRFVYIQKRRIWGRPDPKRSRKAKLAARKAKIKRNRAARFRWKYAKPANITK